MVRGVLNVSALVLLREDSDTNEDRICHDDRKDGKDTRCL